MKNTRKETFTFKKFWGLKRDSISNKWGVTYLPRMNSYTNLISWKSFKKNLLYVYTENKLNGEISPKSVYISFNSNTNFKIFSILSIHTI